MSTEDKKIDNKYPETMQDDIYVPSHIVLEEVIESQEQLNEDNKQNNS